MLIYFTISYADIGMVVIKKYTVVEKKHTSTNQSNIILNYKDINRRIEKGLSLKNNKNTKYCKLEMEREVFEFIFNVTYTRGISKFPIPIQTFGIHSFHLITYLADIVLHSNV